MEIPRHWRLKKQRYGLEGVICPNVDCKKKIFPKRPICPDCHSEVALSSSFSTQLLYTSDSYTGVQERQPQPQEQ